MMLLKESFFVVKFRMVSMTPCNPQSLGISSAGVEAEPPDPSPQPKSHSATLELCYLEFNVPRITYSNVINRIKNVDVTPIFGGYRSRILLSYIAT